MVCLFLFGLVWLLLMGFTTRQVINGLVVQEAARSWPRAAALVESSQLVETKDGSDIYFRADVVYRFRAEGQELLARRVRLSPLTGSRSWAEAMVQRYPEGARTEAFYRPGDPAQCCLEPGISPGQVTFAWFLIPCDLVGCAMLLIALRARRGRRIWGLRPEPQALGPLQGLNPDRISPLIAGCLSLGVASLLVQAPNSLMFDMEPPWGVLAGEAIFVAGTTVATWMAVRRRNAQPFRYLLIDRDGQRLRLPGETWISWQELRGIRVESQSSDDEEDSGGRFWILLEREGRSQPWRSFGSRVEAVELGKWLAAQTGLPWTGPDED